MVTRPVLLLTLSVAVIGSNSLVLSPIAGAVASSFDGAAPADVMIAAAVYGLGTAISALTLAPLADRIGADKALLRAMTVLMVGLMASGLSTKLWALCMAQGLAGLAAGAALPAIYTLSAQIASKGRESETLGIVLTGWTLSMVAGVSLSAVVADLLHWRGVFVSLAGLALLTALLLWRISVPAAMRSAGTATSPLTALRTPGIMRALAVCAAYMIAFYGLYTYLGAHLQDVLGRSTAAAGLAPLAYGVGFGAAVPLDRLIDRHGPTRTSVLIFAALALVYGAIAAAASSFAGLIGLFLLWGVANHLGLNLIVGRLTALDPAQRGAIMGLYSAVTYLSVFAGALAYRPMFALFGFAACALLSMLCIALPLWDALAGRRTGAERIGQKAQVEPPRPNPETSP